MHFRQSQSLEKNVSSETYWAKLTPAFQQWLGKNVKDVQVRLAKPKNDPKIIALIRDIKGKLKEEIVKIDKSYPGLAEAAERLTKEPTEYGVEEKTWPEGGGQNFVIGKEEIILAIHLPRAKYLEYNKDPIMKKFLAIKSNHFDSVQSPLGWALVHKTESNGEPALVVNQIQSDILPRFHSEEAKEKVRPITEQEARERLIANGRQGFAENSELLPLLAQHPDQIEELPAMNNPEQARTWLQNHQEQVRNLQAQGLVNLPQEEEDGETEEKLTPFEFQHIRTELKELIEEWPAIVYQAVKEKAKELEIKNVFMNTSETVDGGCHENKRMYFYERLPKEWGFKKKKIQLPGREKEEELWHKLESSMKKLRIALGRKR